MYRYDQGIQFRSKVNRLFQRPVSPVRSDKFDRAPGYFGCGCLANSGRLDLVVKNPEPLDPYWGNRVWGNGTSNQAHLIVITSTSASFLYNWSEL